MAFDPVAYEREVIRPLRGRHGRLPEGDLVRRYAVEAGMSGAELREHLRKVRTYWNQNASGPDYRAQVCRLLLAADEELRRREGNALHDPQWWAHQGQRRDQEVRQVVQQLAEDLTKAYGPVGWVTKQQLAGVLAHLPALDQRQVDQAVRLARLRVVEPVELPDGSGLDRTAYRHLTERLAEVGAPTIVQLLHPDLTMPFTLVSTFGVPGGPQLALDRELVEERIRQAETLADSAVVRARKAALRVLHSGVSRGADLRTIALYQVAQRLRQARFLGVADVLLIREATTLGLTRQDAELLVLSLPPGGQAAPSAAAGVRALLADGQLRAAQQALAELPAADPERDEVRAQVEQAQATVERLVREAGAAVAGQREGEAERLLREAVRIAADDEDLAVRLRRLPLPPPREPAAVCAGATVALTWQAPDTIAGGLHYRVVRAEERVPASLHDGALVASDQATSAVDQDPPVARPLCYAIFASAAGEVWSRPAVVQALVTPQLTDITVQADQDRIIASWTAHRSVVAVRVRRTEGRPPERDTDGVPVAAAVASFVDSDLREGAEYFYSLVAVYHDARRRELAAPMAVVSAAPRAPVEPVEELSVLPVSIRGDVARVRLSWPTGTGAQVRVRYADRPSPWDVGAVAGIAEIERYGREVVGPRHTARDQTVLEADVPAGYQVYLPVTVGGNDAVVGRPVTMGLAEPVRQLRARRTGDQVVLSWVWPAEASLVSVVWSTPQATTRPRRITRGEYAAGGGCVLSIGPGGGTAAVHAVTVGPSGEAVAPPVEVVVDGRAVRLHYRIERVGGVFSRRRAIRFWADQECSGVEFVVVVSAGRVMPLDAEQGTVANRWSGLLVTPQQQRVEFEVPAGVRRPYWVRCFATAACAVAVVDPPVDDLKVS